MNKLQLARYLKIGSIKEFDYKDPEFEFNYDISFDEAKKKFKDLFLERLSKMPLNDSFLYFSGTLGSCILLNEITKMGYSIPTLSMNLNNSIKDICDYFGVHNHMFEWDDIEDMVMEHQTKYIKEPRCWSLDDIYGWVRARNAVNMGFRKSVCEGSGAEWVLFGDPNRSHPVMNLAIQRGEYKITEAIKYRKKVITRDHEVHSDYLKCYIEKVSYFKDYELLDLGLPIPQFKLREENLKHLTQAAHDWGYNYIVRDNDQPAPAYFGGYEINYIYFDNKPMVDFLLSLPMEMKYNLGRSKHILKECFPLPGDIPQLATGVFKPIQEQILSWSMKACKKYLGKGNLIWDLLNYDKCQYYIWDDFLKMWQLLNLSIWLTHNK